MPRHLPDEIYMRTVENPLEAVWEQLSIFESTFACENLLREKAHDEPVADELIESKAIALAYCVRNGRENLQVLSPSLTTKVITNYYGCLWLAAATVVSNPLNSANLNSIEASTKSGHGLGTIVAADLKFPLNEYVFVKNPGFFPEYLRWSGMSESDLSATFWSERRSKTFESAQDNEKLLYTPLLDLFARIPELTDLYEAICKRDALNFRVSSDGEASVDENVVLRINGNYSLEHLQKTAIPLSNLRLRTDFFGERWFGDFNHANCKHWFQHPSVYRSAEADTCFIAPVLSHISDPVAIHLMLSYQLSILARYRPAVWREVLEGEFDAYRQLILAYSRILNRVVPHKALNKIMDHPVFFLTPGSTKGSC